MDINIVYVGNKNGFPIIKLFPLSLEGRDRLKHLHHSSNYAIDGSICQTLGTFKGCLKNNLEIEAKAGKLEINYYVPCKWEHFGLPNPGIINATFEQLEKHCLES